MLNKELEDATTADKLAGGQKALLAEVWWDFFKISVHTIHRCVQSVKHTILSEVPA